MGGPARRSFCLRIRIMEKIINPKIKSFIQALGMAEKSLTSMAKKIGEGKPRLYTWRIYRSLVDLFLIEARREGREVFVRLTENGKYYFKLFNRLDQR